MVIESNIVEYIALLRGKIQKTLEGNKTGYNIVYRKVFEAGQRRAVEELNF